tara:strand:+ start:769 stop:1335 length:567 start_codon:yes stop_codon:yes gene_type:complete
MNRFFVLSMISLILFFGCASSKPDPVRNKDLPEWVMNPPKYDNKYVGVGSAKRGSFELSKQVATERARVEVARAVETTVNSALNDHMSASGMGDNVTNTEFSESVSKSLVNMTLKGCTIEKTEMIKERVFVMVVYDAEKVREEAKSAARKMAKKEESLFNEFKARQAFDSLDKAMDRMKGSSSVAKSE